MRPGGSLRERIEASGKCCGKLVGHGSVVFAHDGLNQPMKGDSKDDIDRKAASGCRQSRFSMPTQFELPPKEARVKQSILK